jgi:hypothetical protein
MSLLMDALRNVEGTLDIARSEAKLLLESPDSELQMLENDILCLKADLKKALEDRAAALNERDAAGASSGQDWFRIAAERLNDYNRLKGKYDALVRIESRGTRRRAEEDD